MLSNKEDLAALYQRQGLVLLLSYRGSWCPFCVRYLKAVNASRALFPTNCQVFAVSVDNADVCQALQNKLALAYPIISDPNALLATELGVATGKGHGKDPYLQPSAFIFLDGQLQFQWCQQPTWKNLGGAVHRLPVSELVKQLKNHNKKV